MLLLIVQAPQAWFLGQHHNRQTKSGSSSQSHKWKCKRRRWPSNPKAVRSIAPLPDRSTRPGSSSQRHIMSRASARRHQTGCTSRACRKSRIKNQSLSRLVPRSEIYKLGKDRIRTRKTKTPQVRLPAKAKPVKMIAGQTHTVNGPVHDVKTIASKKNDILVPYLEVEKVRKEQERTRKTTTLQVAPPASKGPAVQSNVQTAVVDQGAGSNTMYHEKMVLV